MSQIDAFTAGWQAARRSTSDHPTDQDVQEFVQSRMFEGQGLTVQEQLTAMPTQIATLVDDVVEQWSV